MNYNQAFQNSELIQLAAVVKLQISKELHDLLLCSNIESLHNYLPSCALFLECYLFDKLMGATPNSKDILSKIISEFKDKKKYPLHYAISELYQAYKSHMENKNKNDSLEKNSNNSESKQKSSLLSRMTSGIDLTPKKDNNQLKDKTHEEISFLMTIVMPAILCKIPNSEKIRSYYYKIPYSNITLKSLIAMFNQDHTRPSFLKYNYYQTKNKFQKDILTSLRNHFQQLLDNCMPSQLIPYGSSDSEIYQKILTNFTDMKDIVKNIVYAGYCNDLSILEITVINLLQKIVIIKNDVIKELLIIVRKKTPYRELLQHLKSVINRLNTICANLITNIQGITQEDYNLLNLNFGASLDEIQSVYSEMFTQFNFRKDANSDKEEFKFFKIQQAYYKITTFYKLKEQLNNNIISYIQNSLKGLKNDKENHSLVNGLNRLLYKCNTESPAKKLAEILGDITTYDACFSSSLSKNTTIANFLQECIAADEKLYAKNTKDLLIDLMTINLEKNKNLVFDELNDIVHDLHNQVADFLKQYGVILGNQIGDSRVKTIITKLEQLEIHPKNSKSSFLSFTGHLAIFTKVIQHLSLSDVISLAKTNKLINKAVNSDYFWISQLKRDYAALVHLVDVHSLRQNPKKLYRHCYQNASKMFGEDVLAHLNCIINNDSYSLKTLLNKINSSDFLTKIHPFFNEAKLPLADNTTRYVFSRSLKTEQSLLTFSLKNGTDEIAGVLVEWLKQLDDEESIVAWNRILVFAIENKLDSLFATAIKFVKTNKFDDEYKSTPLELAVYLDHTEYVIDIIERMGVNQDADKILQSAIDNINLQVIELLLPFASNKTTYFVKTTAINKAVVDKLYQCTALLKAKGFSYLCDYMSIYSFIDNINYYNRFVDILDKQIEDFRFFTNGKSLLHHAVLLNNEALFYASCRYRQLINGRDNEQKTPLQYALSNNCDLTFIIMLLLKGAELPVIEIARDYNSLINALELRGATSILREIEPFFNQKSVAITNITIANNPAIMVGSTLNESMDSLINNLHKMYRVSIPNIESSLENKMIWLLKVLTKILRLQIRPINDKEFGQIFSAAIIKKIAYNLSVQDSNGLMRTNKLCYDSLSHDDFWYSIIVRDFPKASKITDKLKNKNIKNIYKNLFQKLYAVFKKDVAQLIIAINQNNIPYFAEQIECNNLDFFTEGRNELLSSMVIEDNLTLRDFLNSEHENPTLLTYIYESGNEAMLNIFIDEARNYDGSTRIATWLMLMSLAIRYGNVIFFNQMVENQVNPFHIGRGLDLLSQAFNHKQPAMFERILNDITVPLPYNNTFLNIAVARAKPKLVKNLLARKCNQLDNPVDIDINDNNKDNFLTCLQLLDANYKLEPMPKDLDTMKPGVIYLEHKLTFNYAVINHVGDTVTGLLTRNGYDTEIKGFAIGGTGINPSAPLNFRELSLYIKDILKITSLNGHTNNPVPYLLSDKVIKTLINNNYIELLKYLLETNYPDGINILFESIELNNESIVCFFLRNYQNKISAAESEKALTLAAKSGNRKITLLLLFRLEVTNIKLDNTHNLDNNCAQICNNYYELKQLWLQLATSCNWKFKSSHVFDFTIKVLQLWLKSQDQLVSPSNTFFEPSEAVQLQFLAKNLISALSNSLVDDAKIIAELQKMFDLNKKIQDPQLYMYLKFLIDKIYTMTKKVSTLNAIDMFHSLKPY